MKKSSTTFTIDGQTYHSFPTLEGYLTEAGIDNATRHTKVMNLFDQQGIIDVSQLFPFAINDFIEIGMTRKYAIILAQHLYRLKRRTKLILGAAEMIKLHQDYRYYLTGINTFDKMMTYANGKNGLRSKTLVEFYGPAGIGKTQILQTIAARTLLQFPEKKILYIDSEGAFDFFRFQSIAISQGLLRSNIISNLMGAVAYNFDEIDEILNQVAIRLREEDFSLIIVDSIINPLKAQYPLDDGLTNLQPRQQHLKQVCDKLKSLANIHDLLVLFSNQVRSSIEDKNNSLVPQGGNVLAHASDMRFAIYPANTDTGENEHLITIELIDCGFLPSNSCIALVGENGVTDWKNDEIADSVETGSSDQSTSDLLNKLYQ